MQTLATLRRFRNLATIVPVLFLAAACSQGDGPESIANEPATPLPPTEPGFCDPINFEAECPDPEIVNFNGGATIIVDNPDPSGINTSDRVARMQKFPDEVFGGTLLNLGDPIDFSEGESYTVKVWSPRPVTVSFKLEEQGNPAGGLTVDEDHGGSGSWEELCFDFTGQAVPTPVVALTIIFDNGTLGQADTDPDNWTFYYDDITQVQSCEATGPGDIQPDAALFKSSGAPDLVIPDDYAERTAFGSGSVIDPNYADDDTFSPVLSVFSGTESGANVAQVGFIGFQEGFLTRYETVDFKVKGMPGFVIFVNLFDGVDALRLNLTSSGYSSELSDGWFQVSIPVADFAGADEATGIVFESDDSAETGFRMLLNDVGFSGTGTHVPADAGVIPEVSLYDRDGTPDLVIPDDFAEITVFGSEAVIDDDFRGDLDFSPALAITTGFGYDIWNAQLAYTGFTPGFATAYATLQFKVKDLSGDVIRVKLLPSADFVDIDVTSSPYATALGNGWFQVELPVADIPGADLSEGLLFETISPAPAESFTYLLTDVGFSGSTGPADSADSIIPENVIFATDPTVTVDFEFGVDYTGFDPFGSGSVFNDSFADDPDFSPVFAVTSGADYGANVGQFAIVGFDAGFAAGFATLDFKVKGMPGDLIRVKFLDNGDYADIDLTTSEYSTALGNGWYQVSVPLTQFTGVDTATALLFESNNTSPDQFTFLLTDIGFSGTASGGGDGGDIAVNGGFETGTFDGWEQFEGGGIQAITTDNPSSGTYAANLNVPVREAGDPGVDNLIKNANLEAGNLTPGASVTVSFDMRGTLAGAGGVVFAELFSELSGGGTSKDEILGGAPLAPTVEWASYVFNTTLGTDVSGGVTLQLKVGCGGVEGCGADIYFDNVSIVVGDTGGTGGADPGTVPDIVIYSSSAAADLEFGVDYTGFEPFGSGSTFDNDVTSDPDFSPVFGVTTGDGYGAQVGQFAVVGFDPGFAATYETLDFKAKGLNNDIIRLKFLDGGDYLDVVLTGSPFSTDLGNGWYQVSIPLTSFTGVDAATGLLFETDNAAPSAFTFLLTDFGFSGSTGLANNPDSIIPENVIFATDPTVTADFEFGVDYTGFEPFGSGSVFNDSFADDPDFSPVFAVTSGAGYGANVGQFAIVGFDAGFAAAFATLDFKVKGMPGDLIRVKFLDNGDYVDIDLTTSDYSTALGNGWYQVSIPLTQFTGVDTATALLFESTNTSPDQFTFLLTDFGFSGTAGGGGGVGAGIIPDNVVYATDPAVTEDLSPAGVDNFGSGAVFDFNFAGDADFNPAIQVTSGEGYGAGVHVGFVAFTGYAAGFAAGYENFVFKVKGDAANLAAFEVKFINNGDTSQTYDLTTYSGVTDLGNGWLQVSIPMSDFAATIAGNDGFLLGPLGGQAAPFTLLLTDIGFTAGGGGIIPDNVVYATDPGVTEDLAPVGVDNFGSGAVFDFNFAGDADFNPAIQVTSGEGYGAGVHVGFVAFTGYAAGFAAGYENFVFKVKGDAGNLAAFEVKFIGNGDTSQTYDLTSYGGVTDLGNGWLQVSIPMSDFAATVAGNDGFLLGPLGGQAAPFTLLLTDIGFTGTAGGGGGGGATGELAVNGDFETGDLSGWETSLNGGTITTTSDSSTGNFAANLNITAAGNPTLKAANLGAGDLTPGQQVTVSFDWKGSEANGGVVDVVLFSELSDGGVSQTDAILSGAGFPSDWTTVGPLTITTGPDVSGGVTLQFTAICGADAGCVSDIYIDNVSIVAN